MSDRVGLGVAGETWVLTASGPRQIRTLVGRQHVAIVHGQPFTSSAEGVRSLGQGRVACVQTVEGYLVWLGPAQPLQLPDGSWTPAERLRSGDRLRLQRHNRADEAPIEDRELLRAASRDACLMEDEDGRRVAVLQLSDQDLIAVQRGLPRLGLPSRISADERVLRIAGPSLRELARQLPREHPLAAEISTAALAGTVEDDPFAASVRSVEVDGWDELFTCYVPGVCAFDANGFVVQHA
ncbi:MAG: hypothetical protein M3069_32440 [Chloroflexota bacterium]|nr:hypothetical protein [Chloroflexota bacterium]